MSRKKNTEAAPAAFKEVETPVTPVVDETQELKNDALNQEESTSAPVEADVEDAKVDAEPEAEGTPAEPETENTSTDAEESTSAPVEADVELEEEGAPAEPETEDTSDDAKDVIVADTEPVDTDTTEAEALFIVKLAPNGNADAIDKITNRLEKLDIPYVVDEDTVILGTTKDEEEAARIKKYLLGKGFRAIIE